MKTMDLNKMGVKETTMPELLETVGGSVSTTTLPTPWLNALVGYIRYSMSTGGDYVIQHAQ
jgi:hypothetical protein